VGRATLDLSTLTQSQLEIELVTASGRAGSLIIPRGLSADSQTLEVSFVRDTLPSADSDSRVGSTIISIELFDDNGRRITQLDQPLIVCLEASSLAGHSSSQLCLSFYDEAEQAWVCEDNDLTDSTDGQLCGETPHLTNFALLLSGGQDSSAGWDKTMSWLTLGFTAGAVGTILVSFVVMEAYYRHKMALQTRRLRNLSRLSQTNQL